MRTSNLTSPRSGKPVANQFVISAEDGRYFQSYNTIIVKVVTMCGGEGVGFYNQLYLDENYWNYSRTTSKYRNQFTGLSTKETEQGIKDGSIKLVDLNGENHIA